MPSDVPFFNLALSANHNEGERIPTKYTFPMLSKSIATGYVVPKDFDFSGIIYISNS